MIQKRFGILHVLWQEHIWDENAFGIHMPAETLLSLEAWENIEHNWARMEDKKHMHYDTDT